jgi:hypothetical protein
MLGHREPQKLSSTMAHDQKGKQALKRQGRNQAKVDSSIVSAWLRRNVRHVCDGGPRCLIMYLETVDSMGRAAFVSLRRRATLGALRGLKVLRPTAFARCLPRGSHSNSYVHSGRGGSNANRCPLWIKSRHVQRTSRCLLSANSGNAFRLGGTTHDLLTLRICLPKNLGVPDARADSPRPHR